MNMNKNERSKMNPSLKRCIAITITLFIIGAIISLSENQQHEYADNASVKQNDVVVTTSISNLNTRPKSTTSKTTTKLTTTTTTVATTTTVTTTEEIYYEEEYEDTYSYYEEEEYIYTDIEESVDNSSNQEVVAGESSGSETYYGTFEGTFYEGGVGTYGYSGRDLISGYSVASNYFPQGSIIRIEGSGLDGVYRVDDTGGMAGNVIDFYYQYGDTPDWFWCYGRVNIEVYLVN